LPAGGLDEDAAVNLVGGAAGDEHEATGAGLDAGGVKVREPDGADGVGAGGLWNVVQGKRRKKSIRSPRLSLVAWRGCGQMQC
jgi:hypothetical protein